MLVYVSATFVVDTDDPAIAESAVERSLPADGSMLVALVRVNNIPAGPDNVWADQPVKLIQHKVHEFDVQG